MYKLVIYQDQIMPYRTGIFNRLSEKVDLTVVYANGELPENIKFKVIKTGYKKIKGYTFLGKEYKRAVAKSDAIILPLTPGIIDTRISLKKSKYIFWGIGVSASYNCRFDSIGDNDSIAKLVKKANCCLFYSSYPIKKYNRLGFNTRKMFVADNTVDIPKIHISEKKNIILFIGSLYHQKKIDELVISYFKAFETEGELPELVIIGDGVMRTWIENYVQEKSLTHKIRLVGEIHDESVLQEYFKKALVCISPDQAGLSVLKAMGYGVPYVTHKEAITGGEIFNISNGENGILYDSHEQLFDIILDVKRFPDKYIDYGNKAYEYFWQQRTSEIMVKGFIDAIEYVCKVKKNGKE